MIPYISVIIPVYNSDKYLKDCITSLINQELDNIEIIIVDDLSMDDSYHIAEKYEKEYPGKIKALKLSKKGRQGGARNYGIKNAIGDYMAFVDSDDRIAPTMYSELYSMAQKYSADIVYGGYYEDYGEKQIPILFANHKNEANCRIDITGENKTDFIADIHPLWTAIYKAELIKENSVYFPENLAYEDNYFSVVVRYFAQSYVYVDKPFYYYNKINTNSTSSKKNAVHHLDRIKTAQMTLDFLKSQHDYEIIKEAVEYIYLEHYYIHTVSCIIYYFDKTDYDLIKDVRMKFLNEFPNYKKNQYYIKKFSKLKRMIFSINEISPRLYVLIYKISRRIQTP